MKYKFTEKKIEGSCFYETTRNKNALAKFSSFIIESIKSDQVAK